MTAYGRMLLLLAVAALVQVSGIGSAEVLWATPNLLLVTVLLAAWYRGCVAGAVGGFAAGLFVDIVTLGELGVTSLLLAVAGHWAGRYAETTGRGKLLSPYLTVFVLTIGYGVAGYLLHVLLGQAGDTSGALRAVVPEAGVNVVLALIVHGVCRRALGADRFGGRTPIDVAPRMAST